jgi:uncharacterized protein (TIGR02145 family)
MKKLILILAIMASAFSAFAQDSLYINKAGGILIPYKISSIDSISFNANKDSLRIYKTGGTVTNYLLSAIDSISFSRKLIKITSTTDSSVVINGVRWATRNVNTPGTFATNPEDAGMFYQWNSKVSWATTGTVTGWNGSWNGDYNTPSATDTWTATNNICPTGWRVPTLAEIQSLLNTSKVTSIWMTQNSVMGRIFIDKTTGNSIFLPASGNRYTINGTLEGSGSIGNYWSSTAWSSVPYDTYGLYFDSWVTAWGNDYLRGYGYSVRPVAQ